MIKRYIDFVSSPAKRDPDKIAVIGNGTRLSFGELDLRTGKLGTALRLAGLDPGDRVALLAKNDVEYVEIQASCHRSGFALVPLNYRLAIPELEFILNDSEPVILIGGRDQHQRVKQLAPMIKSIRKVIGLGKTDDIDSYDDFISECTPDSSADPLDPNLISTILYTSGTTGKPKGAILDRNILSARAFIDAVELRCTSDDIFIEP
jgi:fatty-acyl-CoA synthase